MIDGKLINKDEINVRNLSLLIINKWKTIGIFSFGMVLLSSIYALNITEEFTTDIYLTEVRGDSETSLSSVQSQNNFSFSIPSVLGGGGNGLSSEMNKAIATMRSWHFIDEFIRTNKLEVAILAGNGWDKSTKTLKYNSRKYDVNKQSWVNPNMNINSPDVRWELYNKFKDEISITGDKNTGIHRLSITSYSPDLSYDWAVLFYQLLNKKMMDKKLSIIDGNIKNLRKQVSQNSNSEVNKRLAGFLSKQIETKAIIEASPNYMLEPVSGTKVPYIRSYPRRSLIVVGTTIVSTILFIIFLIFFLLFRKDNN
tara:strand:+ start:59 stop:991 length:933 start_codon:yes stop_codon:yes gene_type:complete